MSSYALILNFRRRRNRLSKRSSNTFGNFARAMLTSAVIVVFFTVTSFSLFSQAVIAEYDKYFSEPSKMLSYKIDTLTIYDRNGEVLYRTPGRYNKNLVPLSEISPFLIQSTLAAEDKGFYNHDGFSMKATARALLADVQKQDLYHQGGSTITQQLSRTFFLTNEKSFSRKIKELVLAVELERKYSKNQILEFYLNTVYYGSGAYGSAEAAKTYFNKDVKDLNLAESALLAGLPVAPTQLSPIEGDRERALNRSKYILDTLKQRGQYSDTEIEAAKKEQISLNKERPNLAEAPHFAVMIKKQLQAQFPNIDLDTSGFSVYTTIDKKMQTRAEKLVRDRVRSLKNRNVTNGAFLATNPQTGEILAMVGSINYNQPQWGSVNILTSPRSPGSSIKPLIYASALESKTISTATILHDDKITYKNEWETYTPTDSDGKTRGDVSPRVALSNSLNIPAVEVIAKNGLPKTLETVKRLGITGLKDQTAYGLSFALGGFELKGIDLAASYGVLANGGDLINPWGIRKVEDRFGNTVFENKVEKKAVLDPRISYIITNILSDTQSRRMLFGNNNPLEIERPAAAKTGTGEDFKNAWTVGYTPSLLSLVWVGNNDGSPMRDIWGLESAALIWNRFMKESLQGTSVEQFTQPEGIKKVKVCALDGSKAVEGQPTIEEIFIDGTEPSEYGRCGYLKMKKDEEENAKKEAERLQKEQEDQKPPEERPHPKEDRPEKPDDKEDDED